MYLHFIYLALGTVNNFPFQLGAFSLVQFASLCCMSSKLIVSIKALNNFRYFVMSSCFIAGQFVCLFGVLGALVVYWSLCSGTGDDPWFGRPGRMNTSRHPIGWSGEDMPPFSRVPTAQLQALGLNLFLSLVCPGLLGSIVLLLPPCGMLSIRLAILYGFFCCFVVKEVLEYFVELVVGPFASRRFFS